MLTIILTHHQQVILTLFHQYLVRLYWLSLSDRSTSAQSVYLTGHITKALSWSNTFNLAETAIIFHSSLFNFDEQRKQYLENYLCSILDCILIQNNSSTKRCYKDDWKCIHWNPSWDHRQTRNRSTRSNYNYLWSNRLKSSHWMHNGKVQRSCWHDKGHRSVDRKVQLLYW